MLREKAEALKIVLGPAGLEFDHASKSPTRECITGVMEGDRNATPIWVCVEPMASALPSEGEPVGRECGDETTGGKRTKTGIPDHPTVTATIGSSEMVTVAGRVSPSSSMVSTTICATS